MAASAAPLGGVGHDTVEFDIFYKCLFHIRRSFSQQEIERIAERAIPGGPINTLDAVFDHPQTQARSMRVDMAHSVPANAIQERVPLIVVTGCVGSQEAERYTHQVFDHQALLRPIVKASLRARAGTVGLVAEKALAIALDGQPGPVHIDLPVSVAEGETDERADAQPGAGGSRATTQAAEGSALRAAREAIAAAQRPVALAGVDAVNAHAGSAITTLCRNFNIPLITTYKAKGLMDEDAPLAIGGAGLSPRADAIPGAGADGCRDHAGAAHARHASRHFHALRRLSSRRWRN